HSFHITVTISSSIAIFLYERQENILKTCISLSDFFDLCSCFNKLPNERRNSRRVIHIESQSSIFRRGASDLGFVFDDFEYVLCEAAAIDFDAVTALTGTELTRPAFGKQSAVVDHRNSCTQFFGLRQIVCGEKDGDSLASDDPRKVFAQS